MTKWAKKAMKDISNTNESVSLYQFKFNKSDGTPHTAFVAATDEEWRKFEAAGSTDLEPLTRSIILLVDGHEPSAQDKTSAERMFKNLFTSETPSRPHSK